MTGMINLNRYPVCFVIHRIDGGAACVQSIILLPEIRTDLL